MTTLNAPPHSLDASLIAALESPDPERALEQAFLQLARGSTLPLVLAMIKALVRCGLAGLASRLLNNASGFLAAEPQLATLAAQLEHLPSGEVSPQEFSHRLQINLNALDRNCSTLRLSTHNSASTFRVFRSSKGNLYVLRHQSSGTLNFIFPFADQIELANALPLPASAIGSAFLMLGVPPVPLLAKIISSTLANGYEPPIDIVETDDNVLLAWLSLVNVSTLLDEERLTIFRGPDALDTYRNYLVQHPTRQHATEIVTNFRARWQPPIIGRDFSEQVIRDRAARIRDEKSLLDKTYALLGPSYWRQRFSDIKNSSTPLRVLGFTTRYSTVIQHSMRDLAAAFKNFGCEFLLVKQTSSSQAAVDVVGALKDFRPDLIVAINHLRSEMIDAIPLHIPYVCWIQDYMERLWTREAGAGVGQYDLVLGHSPDVMAQVYQYPLDRFLPTHNLTSSETFSAAPVFSHDLNLYRCDLSYVGHGSATPEQLVLEMAGNNKNLAKYFSSILALARTRLDDCHALTTQDLVDVVLQAEYDSAHPPLTPELRRRVLLPAAQRIFDRLLRHQSLQWAANWARSHRKSFRIYGQGWDSHPILASFACGDIEHGYPLRCLYQASTISLQINNYGSLHQRLLDGLASGGFVISRYVPADFMATPYRAIQRFISEHEISDLNTLMNWAHNDRQLAQWLYDAERLTGTRIASQSDPIRARHVRSHVLCASLSPNDFADSGLFKLLASGKAVPQRTAGDLPNFEATTFHTELQMHNMLGRFGGDPSLRNTVAAPMRDSVLANDTYNDLVGRILEAFTNRFAQTTQPSCDC